MKLIRLLTLPTFAALALAAGCTPARPTVEDYYAILPDLVRYAERDARQAAEGGPSEGPLWVDSASFAGGGYMLTRRTLDRDSVVAAMRNPEARPVAPPQVIMLRDTGEITLGEGSMLGMEGGRWVREYGVLLRVNLVKWEPGEIAATVTSYTTDRRTWPTGICRRVLRITYEKQDDESWRRSDADVRRGCDDPD